MGAYNTVRGWPGPARAARACRCRSQRLLPLLAEGGVVFIFSPLDAYWRAADPWLNAD